MDGSGRVLVAKAPDFIYGDFYPLPSYQYYLMLRNYLIYSRSFLFSSVNGRCARLARAARNVLARWAAAPSTSRGAFSWLFHLTTAPSECEYLECTASSFYLESSPEGSLWAKTAGARFSQVRVGLQISPISNNKECYPSLSRQM